MPWNLRLLPLWARNACLPTWLPPGVSAYQCDLSGHAIAVVSSTSPTPPPQPPPPPPPHTRTVLLPCRAGRVSDAMLAVPSTMFRTFLAIGFVEALASLLGFVGAANLPGVVLPLLSQTILLWQVLLAVTLLRKRLGAAQVGRGPGGVMILGGEGVGGGRARRQSCPWPACTALKQHSPRLPGLAWL